MNHQIHLARSIAAVLVLTLSLGLQDGAAQENAAAFVLEEIIVTAQKREENLQSVPYSITAISGDYLEKANIETIVGLENRVPGLNVGTFSPTEPQYSIRGIGSGGAVGVFIDDVYMSREQMTTTDFFDLERVEVLRGPQGTLFGRNVVGGAISYHTRQPDDVFESKVQATVGDYSQRDIRAYINGPISETIAGKLSFSSRNRDGYAFNETTGRDIEDLEYWSGRAGLRFKPNSDLSVQVNVDGSSNRGTGLWWDLAIEGPFSQGNSNSNRRSGANHDEDGHADNDQWGGSIKVDWQTTNGALTSITAYRESDMDTRANTTGLLVGELGTPTQFAFHQTLFIQQDIDVVDQFSQEIRFTSTGDSAFNWLVGLYYLDVDWIHTGITDFRFTFFNTEGREIFRGAGATESTGVFANFSYDFTDRIRLQLGARWTEDKKEQQLIAAGVSFIPYTDGLMPSPGGWTTNLVSDSWSELTPAGSLKFQATDDALLYATVAKGFKSGGFPQGNRERLGNEVPFSPEFAWNYEIGAKTEWLDNRLRLNVSAFYMDYEDLQVNLVLQPDPNLPPFGVTGNAGEAEVKGVELEWTWLATQNLDFYGNYSKTSSEIQNLSIGGNDLSGNEVPAPDSKAFVGIDYMKPLGRGAAAGFRVEYIYFSDYFHRITNAPIETIPSRGTFDASITYEGASRNWDLRLWGKNLADDLNINTITEVPPSEGYASYTPPRTYGATLTVRFN